MSSLAMIDPWVSAGGLERFVSGLLGSLLRSERAKSWQIDLLISPSNSAGLDVLWPEMVATGRGEVGFFPRESCSPLFDRLFFSEGKLPGIRRIRHHSGAALRCYGPRKVRELAGNRKTLIEKYLKDRPHDVVYFPYPYHMGCPRVETPMVITPHDFGFWHFERSTRRYLKRLQHDMGDFVEASSLIVVSSEFIANEVKGFFPAAAGKVRVVRAGIPKGDHRPMAEDLAACKEKFDLPERFIINAGWIFEHKNQQVILRALGELKRRGKPVMLLLAGPNTDDVNHPPGARTSKDIERLLRVASEEGLKPGLDFRGVGFVTDLELECLYSLASALVVSSLYEAGSFPLIEAIDAGCLAICSSIPPFIEQVEAVGGNAVSFDPRDHMALADALQWVFDEPEEAAAMAEKATRLVGEAYSWDKMALGYTEAFEEAAAIGKPARKQV